MPNRHGLSLCATTPAGFKSWIDSLPKANIGETARLLYQTLSELNQLLTPAENRLQLLELLSPVVSFVCQQMERHFLNQPIVLAEHPRRVANLCQTLQTHLNTGYKIILTEASEQPGGDQLLLTTALQRTIQGITTYLIRTLQLYCPIAPGLWLELHQLYLIARRQKLHRVALSNPQGRHSPSTTIERSYTIALLLGCARCNQMRQESIARLGYALESWSALVNLTPGDTATTLFAVVPQLDNPPCYSSLLNPAQQQTAFGIDVSQLVEAINKYLQPAEQDQPQSLLQIPDGLSYETLQHLAMAWGDISERSYQRIPGTGSMRICIGMSALNYFLADRTSFSELLSLPENLTASFDYVEPPTDIWSQALSVQPITGMPQAPVSGGIEYSGLSAEDSTQECRDDNYPIYTLSIVNHSSNGYCLSWPNEVPSQLQTGELLGLQDATTKGWSVAMVRWINRMRGGSTQMGIELITPKAQSCGLQLLSKSEQKSQYLRALLLPKINTIAKPATIITPRLPFQEDNKVMININGSIRRAVLGQKLIGSSSFSQFEYRNLDTPTENQTGSGTTSGSTQPPQEEDLDSLWKSL